jgi:hypothetical protein
MRLDDMEIEGDVMKEVLLFPGFGWPLNFKNYLSLLNVELN